MQKKLANELLSIIRFPLSKVKAPPHMALAREKKAPGSLEGEANAAAVDWLLSERRKCALFIF
ncbi:hypothetical protein I0D00_08220 [Pseudomonas lalucatii]|uniref:Uncharacterized protein n=1 Tax=Pseudomonas lalucatii TaxID=1424203 RepID=A0ABS5PZM8_9PSED|nr:hypothetical protein [Pseudomonas lalucatii]MBS7661932.1 hypothetical protein [Pseudomonas lalucatii]